MAYLDENGLEHFWGKIKDHVSSAIAPKANDADVVHKTGDETVGGLKTFQNSQNIPNTEETGTDFVLRNPEVSRGTPLESGRSWTRVIFADKEGDTEATQAGRLGLVEIMSPKEGDTIGSQMLLSCYKYSSNPADYTKRSQFTLGYDGNDIPYATAPATSDDRTVSTDVVTRGFMEASEWNWQKTKKNALVQFKPVFESDLEPVVDFMFTETPPAEGEKGPDNPSTISGIPSINAGICGKNLLKTLSTSSGIFTIDPDGTLTANGVLSSTTHFAFIFPLSRPLPPGKYTLSFNNNKVASDVRCSLRKSNSDWGSPDDIGRDGYLTTASNVRAVEIKEGSDNALFRLTFPAATYDNLVIKMQFESGTVATEYEPPVRNGYTIALGDTYYGGSLDVSTGLMTVTWHGTKLTSASDFRGPFDIAQSGSNKRYVANLPYGSASYTATNQACSHYNYSHSFDSNIQQAWVSSSGACYIYDSFATLAELNTFLDSQNSNGTPVIICYQLASPYTVQLTPTQIRSLPALDKYKPRINTVYTDQEAVQVGYQRFANYVDLTTNQTITGDKTFSSGLQIKATNLDVTNSSTSQDLWKGLNWFDVNDKTLLTWSIHYGGSERTFALRLTDSSITSHYLIYWGMNHDGTNPYVVPGGDLYPTVDNAYYCGKSNRRWKSVYAVNGTIQTSDERVKEDITSLPDSILDVWDSVEWQQFRMKASIERKGNSARLHSGIIAQRVRDAFASAGLDASDYGFFCFDRWDEVPARLDEQGNVAIPAIPAGEQYSIRYDEALALEAAYMRRENARLKKRVADLEERLAALELKIS